MRGAVDGLGSPFPLGEQLPSVYADDEFAQRFVTGLDDLFAPLLSVLDNFPAYLRPELAPSDFVAWLGGWVGAELSGDESDPDLRAAVAGAAGLHRYRGTVHGLAEAVRLGFGIEPRDPRERRHGLVGAPARAAARGAGAVPGGPAHRRAGPLGRSGPAAGAGRRGPAGAHPVLRRRRRILKGCGTRRCPPISVS